MQATVALDDNEGPVDEVSDARRVYELAAEKLCEALFAVRACTGWGGGRRPPRFPALTGSLQLWRRCSATDPASAADLLRGTVHECDRLLRASCSASGDSASASDLPPRFYLTYGSAVHDLSNLVHLEHDDALGPEAAEDRRQYVALARDLLETGVAKAEQRPSLDLGEVGELTVALAKVMLLQAEAENAEEDELDADAAALAEDALRKFKEGTENLRRSASGEVAQAWIPDTLAVAALVHAHADKRDEPEVRSSWNAWSICQLEDVLKVDPDNAQALECLGNCYLSISHVHLDQDDTDDEGEGDGQSSAGDDLSAAQARPLLHKGQCGRFILSFFPYHAAVQFLDSRMNCREWLLLRILLAEAQINLGNVDDSEEGQQSLYRQAVALLTKARAMKREATHETDDGQFPPQLEAFIEEWEAE
ncbi:MAG: hypothetical protein BJ554DRAFT_836, partial [Olpidium bornovanus]